MYHLFMRDILPFILEMLDDLDDIINVDLTCKLLNDANTNGGWKTFATKIMAIPSSYKDDNNDNNHDDDDDDDDMNVSMMSWKVFLLSRVRPIYGGVSRICSRAALKTRAEQCVASDIFKRYNPDKYEYYEKLVNENTFPPRPEKCREVLAKQDWPKDVGIFIACHCYLSQAIPNGNSFFNFGYDDAEEPSSESFAFFDSFALGGGDTNWWCYVVLKGTVLVPLAPPGYARNKTREQPVEIGRGGIVAFSHWNHGGCETTPKHVHPAWDPSEFGFDELEYDDVCDDWVRINLLEPVGGSRDSLPAAWTDIFHFMKEVEASLGKN
eukprot:TRINITY_DN3948_c0_g1_i2.p1 TRINITY_DN3948_c0_g1~~TRINITY_DN3948_c0_g1_i2.p1  ORF type:complete len:341 (+),score=71.21 TRINITY_DN3948_c0_g1_i2:54-1025(+)